MPRASGCLFPAAIRTFRSPAISKPVEMHRKARWRQIGIDRHRSSLATRAMSAQHLETEMLPGNHRVIVINGVRYNVAIRLDSRWKYITDWGSHEFDRSDSVSLAASEIQKAHLKQEPWLSVEMAGADGEDV